ncbi:MAG TPA: DNA polymerase III subunit delta, partial [Opitutales bacterium]|nr:DNA polymerase III subunit delta [Opitutales bacterium]
QSRNRLMIQLKALLDAGIIRVTPRGLDRAGLETAQSRFNPSGELEKSSVNLFTQNPWYLGKLAQSAQGISLKKLLAWQLAFIHAFEELINRPQEPLAVMRELAIRCLG